MIFDRKGGEKVINSLEFVKKRINNKCAYVPLLEDTTFTEIKFDEWVKLNIPSVPSNLPINIVYDDDTDFEYFTMERCVCDGTLLFMQELLQRIYFKILNLQTVNKTKVFLKVIENPFQYNFCYTVGNFVFCCEHGDFGVKDKPWMKSRFTAMLPIKFEIKIKN